MVQKKDIEKRIEDLQGEILNFLRDIVEHESPTSDREAVNSLGEKLKKKFMQYLPEAKTYGDEYRVFLLRKGKGNSIFISHIDTVHPIGTIKINPFRKENGKVFGPGVLDMKAGVVALYFAIKIVSEHGLLPDFAFLMNTEEEEGSSHTRDYMKRISRDYKYCFSLEPSGPDGKLKTSRKGVISLRISVKGRMAHAGLAPEKGVNAIDELIDQLSELREWISVREGSFTIGVIRGGEKPNVVPGDAFALVDIRFEKEGFSEMLNEYMNNISPVRKGAVVTMNFESFVPPLIPSLQQRKLYTRLKNLLSGIGVEIEETHSAGGSDASWFSRWGLAAIDGLGPSGEGAHSENEFLYFESLKQRILILTYILMHLKELTP